VDQPRDAIVLVDLQNALGELHPFLNLAIGQHRQEGAAEQFVVTGITAQRGAVIRRRRRDVALITRVPSGEIAARRRRWEKASRGCDCAQADTIPGQVMASAASAATAARRKSGEAIMARRLHLADETPLDRSGLNRERREAPMGSKRVRRGQWSPVGDNV